MKSSSKKLPLSPLSSVDMASRLAMRASSSSSSAQIGAEYDIKSITIDKKLVQAHKPQEELFVENFLNEMQPVFKTSNTSMMTMAPTSAVADRASKQSTDLAESRLAKLGPGEDFLKLNSQMPSILPPNILSPTQENSAAVESNSWECEEEISLDEH